MLIPTLFLDSALLCAFADLKGTRAIGCGGKIHRHCHSCVVKQHNSGRSVCAMLKWCGSSPTVSCVLTGKEIGNGGLGGSCWRIDICDLSDWINDLLITDRRITSLHACKWKRDEKYVEIRVWNVRNGCIHKMTCCLEVSFCCLHFKDSAK